MDVHSKEVSNSVPVPLAQKRFALGNVKEVTVTDQEILVPFIPVSNNEKLLQESAVKLTELVDQGLPFFRAAKWLKRNVGSAQYKTLEQRYS